MSSPLKLRVALGLVFATGLISATGCATDRSFDPFIPIDTGDVELAAEVHYPDSPGPHPGLVMVHGSGRAVRQGFRGAAELYADLGFVTVIYDKRGAGQSGGSFRDVTASNSNEVFSTLADDVVAAVEWLAQEPQVDADNIGLLGTSQAGWIMPLAASRSDAVAFMVSVSGAASTVGESDEYDRHAESSTPAELRRRLERFDGEHGFDPAPFLAALRIPALWAYGALDLSNPTELDLERIAIAETQGPRKDFTVHVFPTADHEFRDAHTGEPINAIVDCVGPWLAQQRQRTSAEDGPSTGAAPSATAAGPR